ncbi:MATE family efflux transporter [Burkholderia sp. Bp8963]|uniref:MATE family efflux transporter n=1 Tax=Burkholderia sp. Bp8963 TaxID=2184547 RepID=UPI00163AEACD|nr:MATE family efflux transporter [Burkholderia sp. Bp8963]
MVGGFAGLGAVLMLLVAAVVGVVGDRVFIRLDAPRETLQHAARFVTCMQLSSAVLAAGVLANAAVFARGLARRALAISIAANLVNLVVTAGCSFLLRQGALGGAWGTGVAGSVMLAASFASLPRSAGVWQHWRSAARRVIAMTRGIAIPVFGSYLVLSIYAAALNDVLMSIGPDAVAGFGIANRLQSLLMMPAVALGTALAIRAGGMHRIGASASDVSVARLAGRGLVVGIVLYALVSAIVIAARPLITPLMAEAGAAAVLGEYLLIVCPSFVFFGPMLALLIYLEQMGQGRLALLFNVASLGMTFVCAYAVAARSHLIGDVFIAIAACNVVTALALFVIVRKSAVHRPPRTLAHGGSL